MKLFQRVLLTILLLTIPIAVWADSTDARVLSCEQVTANDSALTKFESMLVQVGLYHLQHEHMRNSKQQVRTEANERDGIIGPITRATVSQFCQTLLPSQQRDVIDSLFLHAALKSVQPRCTNIVDVDELQGWITRQSHSSAKKWVQGLWQVCHAEQFLRRENENMYFQVNAQDLDLLAEQKNNGQRDESMLVALQAMLDKPYPTPQLFMDALANLAKLSISRDEREFILDNVRKPLVIQPIPLQADDCDCVQDFYYDETLYHFYPAYLGHAQEAEPPTEFKIDYSMVTRIAFQGLRLDRHGSIATEQMSRPLHMWQQQQTQFIQQAHRFYSKVDLVFELEEWVSWDQRSAQNALTTLQNLVLNNPVSDKQLDGITLYFSDYQQDEFHSEQLNMLVRSLLNVKQDYPDLMLNILLDMALCSEGENCQNLARESLKEAFNLCDILVGGYMDSSHTANACSLSQDHNKEQSIDVSTVDLVLIYLPEETTESKKYLHRLIEEKFKGEARNMVLDKIIPIISPYNLGADLKPDMSQLKHDLIYAKHKFGGAGFWPMPLVGDEAFVEWHQVTAAAMLDPVASNNIEWLVKSILPQSVCSMLCTQREYVRIIFYTFLVLMICTLVFKHASCYLCRLIERYFRTYLLLWLVTLMVFISILGCDKFWEDKADLAIFIAFLIVLVVIMISYVAKLKKGKQP